MTNHARLPPRCRRRSRWRVQRQRQRREGFLREIEFLPQIAEVLDFLSDRGARVGSSVRRRIKPLPTQEHVFYELQIGVERERLVIDRPCTYPRRDHDAGNTESITVDVEVGRVYVGSGTPPVTPPLGERPRSPKATVPSSGPHPFGIPLSPRPQRPASPGV